jgi:F-type H+-transporting ATPase subunit alpha
MAASLFAVNKGFFDDLDVKRVLAFEAGLHGWLKDKNAALMSKLESEKALSKESEAELTAAIEAFKKTFA